MKLLSILSMLFAFNTVCFAQSYESLTVIVLDKETRKPVSGVSFSIKEMGWPTKTTGNDGKVFFEKSVPVGEITYMVMKEGYLGYTERFNITTEAKSNTLAIDLTRTPGPAEDKILIRGEVTDKNNKDVANAVVEVKIADITQTATTDQSGNYQLMLMLSKSSFQENSLRLEVKYNSCKKVETVDLPRNKVINKDIILDCTAEGGGKKNTESNPGAKKTTVQGVEITVERCSLSGNKLICELTYQLVGSVPSTTITFRTSSNKLIDEKGNTYISEKQSIGNLESKNKYNFVRYELVKGAVVKGLIEFFIGEPLTKISSITIGDKLLVHKFSDIQVYQ